MTNITVRSKAANDYITHEGDGWDTDEAENLHIRSGETVIATYARGEWTSVKR